MLLYRVSVHSLQAAIIVKYADEELPS